MIDTPGRAAIDGYDAPSPPPARVRGRWRRWWLPAAVVAAIGLQVRVWLADHGLWEDEIYVAVNLPHFSELHPTVALQHRQVTPPGWLILAKESTRVFGLSEWALRLPALIGAATAVVLIGLLALRSTGRVAALVAVGAAALAPRLLYYSAEVKQYSTEAAVALAIVLAAGWLLAGRRLDRRRLVVFAAVALVSMPLAYAGLLVLAGVVGGGGLLLLVRRRLRDAVLFGLSALPAALLGVRLVRIRMHQPFTPNQFGFFVNGMPPAGSGPSALPGWLPRMWTGFTADPLVWGIPAVLLLVFGLGIVSWFARGRAVWAALVLGVFAVAIAAAAAGSYPLASRVALYLLGPTIVTAVAGVDGVTRLAAGALRRWRDGQGPAAPVPAASPRSRRGSAVLWILPAVVVLPLTAVSAWPSVVLGVAEVRTPPYVDPIRDVMADVHSKLQPGDVVLVYRYSLDSLSWYGKDLPVTGVTYLSTSDPCPPQSLRHSLEGADRVWYVSGVGGSGAQTDVQTAVVSRLARFGTVIAARTWPGYLGSPPGWTLVDLTTGADPDPPPFPADVWTTCLTTFY